MSTFINNQITANYCPIKVESLKHWIDAWVEGGTFPGLMVGIYNNESKEIFYHAHDNGATKKYTKDTLFRIYSMTKPITTVGILILLERGLISLDDPVSKYIPAFENIAVLTGGTVDNFTTEPCQTPLKVIHLLTHTSGISYGFFGNTLNDQLIRKNVGEDFKHWFHFTSLADLCEGIAKSQLAFQPGTKYLYGLNTDVLGYIIEIISGMKLDEFMEKEIFNPLGMKDTTFQVTPENSSRLADIYDVAPGQGFKISENPERDRLHSPILLAGGGGLVSTMEDYARFAVCLLNKGLLAPNDTKRLLKEETVDLMAQNHLQNDSNLAEMSYDIAFSEAFGPGFGFGLGVSVIKDPKLVKGGSLSSAGEYGWGGVAGTSFFIDYGQKFTAILLTQLIPGASVYPIRSQVRWLSHSLVQSENH